MARPSVNLFRKHHVDQGDLQGNVLAAYGTDYRYALYLFVGLDEKDEVPGRRWLGELIPRVTNAERWEGGRQPSVTLNICVTADGLSCLGVPGPLLETFPDEFLAGMAASAETLGDVGLSAPKDWDKGIRAGQPHVLVTVHALTPEALEVERKRLTARIERKGSKLTLMRTESAAVLGEPSTAVGREHFGFKDGFGQPTIRGNAGPWDRAGGGTRTKNGWKPVAPGEFVLGYPEEDGTTAAKSSEPLQRNGTFTVVRKLYQDVAQFTKYLRATAAETGKAEEWLAARIVGRWRDGTPLELSPDESNPSIKDERGPGGKINDFHYSEDPEGLRCPLGAHVRRANPRDALGWEGRLTKRHRIIRRGMPYGPAPKDPAAPDRVDRGLMFVCHQSSIRRQFEVIQGQWLSDGDAFWMGMERDAFRTGTTQVTIPGRPPIFLPKPPPLVITRGGGYFFTPGINALHTIASAAWN